MSAQLFHFVEKSCSLKANSLKLHFVHVFFIFFLPCVISEGNIISCIIVQTEMGELSADQTQQETVKSDIAPWR